MRHCGFVGKCRGPTVHHLSPLSLARNPILFSLAVLSLRSPSRLLAAVAAKEPELGGDGSEGSGGARVGGTAAAAEVE